MLVRAGLSRRHVLWSVDESLKRLGTDWIGLFLRLTEAEVAALDAATTPALVYPNWFIDRLADQPLADALAR